MFIPKKAAPVRKPAITEQAALTVMEYVIYVKRELEQMPRPVFHKLKLRHWYKGAYTHKEYMKEIQFHITMIYRHYLRWLLDGHADGLKDVMWQFNHWGHLFERTSGDLTGIVDFKAFTIQRKLRLLVE